MKDDLKFLLEKNLAMTEEIYGMVKKIKRYIFLSQLFDVIKLVIILAPIIFAIIYLPPLLKGLISPYQELLNNDTQSSNLDLSGVSDALKKLPGVK